CRVERELWDLEKALEAGAIDPTVHAPNCVAGRWSDADSGSLALRLKLFACVIAVEAVQGRLRTLKRVREQSPGLRALKATPHPRHGLAAPVRGAQVQPTVVRAGSPAADVAPVNQEDLVPPARAE